MKSIQNQTIGSKISQLKEAIRGIAGRVHRSSDEIRFILVTKTVSPDKIQEAFDAGIRDFGENRMQDFLAKKGELPDDIRWHFVGRLQNNKVKFLVEQIKLNPENPPLLHSLDRPELVLEIERQATQKRIGRVPCLIQVNSSGEATKGGFVPEEVAAFVGKLREDSPIEIRGLMTIGPFTEDRKKIREAFRMMKRLQEELQKKYGKKQWNLLSMGMSSDYEIAIEEGANLLRLGRVIFGPRKEGTS